MATVISQKFGFWLALAGNMFSLLALVHALAPITGAHFNPVVTVSALITRHIGLLNGLFYIVSHFLGAIVGSAFTWIIEGNDGMHLGAFVMTKDDPLRGLLFESLMAFFTTSP